MLIRFKSLSGCYGSGVEFKNIVEHQYGNVYKVLDKPKFFLMVIKYGIEFKELEWITVKDENIHY